MYSVITESGLYPYVFQLEMDRIGAAEAISAGVLTFCVLAAPLLAITSIVGKISQRWFGPPQPRQPIRSPEIQNQIFWNV